MARVCLKDPILFAKEITFIALGVLAFVFGLSFAVWGQRLSSLHPRAVWLRVLIGVCIFLYSTLDNIDGKQARKLGAASPLGLIVDHGCDGLATGFLSILCVQLLDFPGLQACTLALLFCVSFYSKTVEHSATGSLDLGWINAVDEGLPVLALICTFSDLVSYVLRYSAFFGLIWRDVLFCLLMVVTGTMVWSAAVAVMRVQNFTWAVDATCIYAILLAGTFILITSPAAHGNEKWVLTAFAFIHARLTAELIVSHVCGAKPLFLMPYPLALALVMGGLGLAALLLPKSSSKWLTVGVQVYAAVCVLYALLFGWTLVHSLASVLEIRVLHLPTNANNS